MESVFPVCRRVDSMNKILCGSQVMMILSCLVVPSIGQQRQYTVIQRDTITVRDSVAVVVECLKIARPAPQPQDAFVRKDTVVQNNGQLVTGTIIENSPGSTLRIRVAPHVIWVIYYSDIAKINGAAQAAQPKNVSME